MYSIDLEEGEIKIDGRTIDLDKDDCVVLEKGRGTNKKVFLACGEDKEEKIREIIYGLDV